MRQEFGVEPDVWQLEVLCAWDRGDQRVAMKACKGPGKTAILAWLVWHFMLTRIDAKVPCTSISGDNLADGLWAEMAKWRNKSKLLTAAFEWTKTRVFAKERPETWFATARTWSKSADPTQQADTLAGLHADHILFVLDEAGGIPDGVMAAAQAALSTEHGETRLLIAGNPTLRSGPLWRACNAERAYWTVVTITGDPDAPNRSPRISVDWARAQIAQYGRDNPWVLANVFGEFPPAGATTFIGADVVEQAQTIDAVAQMYDAFVLGVDVARFGDDESVIYLRKGRDGRTHPPLRFRNLDNMQLAARIAEQWNYYQADAVFIDGGAGSGVIDRLRQLRIPAVEVNFGATPDNVLASSGEGMAWADKAAEMWAAMREWLRTGGAIPNEPTLAQQLSDRNYEFVFKRGRDCVRLESKDDMKARGVGSPDIADALALTFAYPVVPNARSGGEGLPRHRGVQTEFDPYRDVATALAVNDWDPYRD